VSYCFSEKLPYTEFDPVKNVTSTDLRGVERTERRQLKE
jgi:hypothetical protein